jgi:3-oxoacyl-[acyl-carrier protein] reductase
VSEELQGAVAAVTGASRGIGLATAVELARGGARVALLSRDESRVKDAAARLPERRGQGVACDVVDPDQVDQAVERIESDLGPITILVNNAGLTRDRLVLRMRGEDWDSVLDVNLRGAFNMIRAVSRGMVRRREGVIVNVSSVVALMGNPGQANYAAAKAGLIGMTKSVARELAPRGIRANVVAPGFIDTQMTADLDDKARAFLLARIPLGHLGEAEDVAPVIRFLAGPGARYITGQVIVVDGGMVM